uniref:Uncharacterized protein n=1 Tax=Steinernema glaseri TaxID=37863 RepID=A0A1I7Y7Z0_9BILA
METVPFAFTNAVVNALPAEVYAAYCCPLLSEEKSLWNLKRLSSAIWSEPASRVYEDLTTFNARYRQMSQVTIYPGEERGMCFCEIKEDTPQFPRNITLKDVISSRFLRTGSINFVDKKPHEDNLDHISLEDAFTKLVIPFSVDGLDFYIDKDHLFFLDVLNKLHKYQLVLSSLFLGSLSSELYERVESEFNKFLTFQIEQRCLRKFYTPDAQKFPFSIPDDVFSKLFSQPQLEYTNHRLSARFPTEALEALVARLRFSPRSCYHEKLTFDENLNHKKLQRMGFKEITRWKKLRRLLRAVKLRSLMSSYRAYLLEFQECRLRVVYCTSTMMGRIGVFSRRR